MDPAQYVRDVLVRPTDRDKQRKVGASNLSNACTRCLAEDMMGVRRGTSKYNMGAIVGTAIHEYLEQRNTDPTAQREMRVELGEIPGYGTISSTTDLYLPEKEAVFDFKTTTYDKLTTYQRAGEQPPSKFDTDQLRGARETLERYFRQAQLYAYGVERLGKPVRTVAIVFICRDGRIVDRDVWAPPPRPYNPEQAKKILERAHKIWNYLQTEGDVERLKSDEHCYYCNFVRPTIIEEVEL